EAKAFHYVVYPFTCALNPEPFQKSSTLSPSGPTITATAWVKFQIKDDRTVTNLLKWFRADLLSATSDEITRHLTLKLGSWLKERREPWRPTARQVGDHLNAVVAEHGLTVIVEDFLYVPDSKERRQRATAVTKLRRLARKRPGRYQEAHR